MYEMPSIIRLTPGLEEVVITRFPVQAARTLGFAKEKLLPGLLSPEIGNTYAGSSLMGLSALLDAAGADERILHVSFGSGAGSDAFAWRTTPRLVERRFTAPTTRDYVERQVEILTVRIGVADVAPADDQKPDAVVRSLDELPAAVAALEG